METVDAGERVVVVGSGATGSWAAHRLTRAGVPVLLLEAGSWPVAGAVPERPPSAPLGVADERARLRATRARRETQRIQRACYAFTPRTAPLFVSDADQPYAVAAGTDYRWIRVRAVGGRTLVWNGIALRMADGGLGVPAAGGAWPLTPRELEPHYRDAEAFFAVDATSDPALAPDGAPGAAAAHAQQQLVRRRIERRWPSRRVVRVPRFRSAVHAGPAPLRAETLPAHSCGGALAAAMRSGRLELQTDSVVCRLDLDDEGRRVVAAEVADARGGRRRRVRGRAFVLCASALESTRILLNSACARHPDGLGNGSGLLGAYLSDHLVGVSAIGVADARGRAGGPLVRSELYVPPFRNVTEPAAGFAGTYGVQIAVAAPGDAASASGGTCALHAFGTVRPRRDSRVELDPSLADRLGVPALRIGARYGGHEARMAADQACVLAEMLDVLGCRMVHLSARPDVPGSSMHEVGTARMGSRPEDSVVDAWNRVWGVENALVADGACFVEMGAANPTLTMLAMTGRACDALVRRLADGAP